MRRLVVTLLGVLAIAAVAFLGYQRISAGGASRGAANEVQTAKVQRGTIIATVFAVGNVVPSREANLVFSTIGTVKEVLVNVGDAVEAGQTLAALDTTDLEQDVANAQLNQTIREAELARMSAGPTQAELNAVQAALKAAQETLKQIKAGPRSEDVAAARSAVQAAQSRYNLLTQSNTDAVHQAQLQLEYAKNALWHAQTQRDMACNIEKSKSLCDSFEAEVGNGNVQVQMAELALQQAQSPASDAEVQSAQSQVDAAQASLDQIRAGAGAAEIATAEAQVAQAQAQLEKLTTGAVSEDVHIAEARLAQAQLAMTQSERRLQDATLVAPYPGVVSAVSYRAGDRVRPELPGIMLSDLTKLEIKVSVAEVDVDQIHVGQKAEVVLDALPDKSIVGHVATLAPAARSEQGVVNYPVTIALDGEAPEMKPGMTGNVRIVIGQRDNILFVPNRAIRRTGGQRIVGVLRGEEVVETPVRIGINNETVTEIVEGLQPGDRVVLNLTTSQSGLGSGLLQGGGSQ